MRSSFLYFAKKAGLSGMYLSAYHVFKLNQTRSGHLYNLSNLSFNLFSDFELVKLKDATTRLAEAAIKIITDQVKVQGNSMTLRPDEDGLSWNIETMEWQWCNDWWKVSELTMIALMIQAYSWLQYYKVTWWEYIYILIPNQHSVTTDYWWLL